MVYMYKGTFPLRLKKKEMLIQAKTWIYLEDVVLSERSQTQMDKYCMILLRFIKTDEQKRGNQGLRGGAVGSYFLEFRVSVWGDEKSWRWVVVMVVPV